METHRLSAMYKSFPASVAHSKANIRILVMSTASAGHSLRQLERLACEIRRRARGEWRRSGMFSELCFKESHAPARKQAIWSCGNEARVTGPRRGELRRYVTHIFNQSGSGRTSVLIHARKGASERAIAAFRAAEIPRFCTRRKSATAEKPVPKLASRQVEGSHHRQRKFC